MPMNFICTNYNKHQCVPQILLLFKGLWHNDIALIKLEEPVPVSASDIPEIQAVKLPLAWDMSFPLDNQECIMKGWGCSTNGRYYT